MRAICALGFVQGALCLWAQSPPETELGEVNFATSGSPEAQKCFLRGLLELHNFEYEDAREDFQAAEKAEPGFAMAYWGEAMTYNHPLWAEQDRDAALGVLAKVPGAPTERESAYLHAIRILYGDGNKSDRDKAYAESMRQLHERYPDDPDAACFYGLSLLGSTQGKRDFAIYMRSAAALEEVFAKYPRHPGAVHYLIHSYDDPVHAPLGLRPARVYAKLAPAAEHAQHMPSHIFIALGMWDEVVTSNEISWLVSEERQHRKKLGVDELGYHALSWLEYAYLQQGRYEDARKTLLIAEQNAQISGSKRTRSALATMRAAYLAETGQWTSEVQPPNTHDLGVVPNATNLFTNAMVMLQTGPGTGVASILLELHALGTVNDAASSPEMHHGGYSQHSHDALAARVMADEVESGWLMKQGKMDAALEKARGIASMEDSLNFEFGPPVPVIPAHEFYGQMLLRLGKPKQAEEEFRLALQRAPARTNSMIGLARAAKATGDHATAKESLGMLEHNWHRADEAITENVLAEFSSLK